MKTIEIVVNADTWTQLTAQPIFTIQNIGSLESATPIVYVSAGDLTPTTLRGNEIAHRSGITSCMMEGVLWGKTESGTAIIAVTE